VVVLERGAVVLTLPWVVLVAVLERGAVVLTLPVHPVVLVADELLC